MTQNDIVQKLWNLCDILRDEGINYSNYVTELVQLLFIKMEAEIVQNNDNAKHKLPEGSRWHDINKASGVTLRNKYRQILLDLSKSDDRLIAAIYSKAKTSIDEPKHLEQLIKTLDGIDWFSATKDGLGDLYEGLLEKNATETKSGAGQYFTPRVLINSMVNCIKPQAGEIVSDPAAGTAGFLIAADSYIKAHTDDLYDLTEQQANFQRQKAFIGVELVADTHRLALMNCLLHNIEGEDAGAIRLGTSLGQLGANLPKSDVILANPPFGTAKGGDKSVSRDDLTFKTSNKQLAFLQHIYRNLKAGGRAAVVLPDNVLFEAGIGTDVRCDLMDKCNLHTILRLPTGIFYAQGVKTNVLFFGKGTVDDPEQDKGCTQNVWVYDLRTNMPSFGKRTPFTASYLEPFERVYGDEPLGRAPRTEGEWSFTDGEQSLENSRWRVFSREWISEQKGDSLDISWLKDSESVDAENLAEPQVLASEAMAELTGAVQELNELLIALGAVDEVTAQKEFLVESLGLGKELESE
ncbi:N-6 DNA methylase [Moraxella osloensis]|jgi:type I restriction enzyme M protein|nr:N-6 DNA methylase [Moraxella osloensis]MDK1670558.1 N-6 DNA methylase [Moraxella osloensis]